MPTALEILRDNPEATPPWLDAFAADTPLNTEMFVAMLKSRVVFYPGAGINDGETFEVFTRSHAAHCVIHVDLDRNPRLVSRVVNGEIPGPRARIAGYRPIAQQVLAPDVFQALAGLESEHPFGQAPELGGAYWAVLEREAGLTDDHGPARIVFLHVQCEAVWLFWNLWCRLRTTGPFAMLVQSHGGGGYPNFGADSDLHHLAVRYGVLPEWILFGLRYGGTTLWPNYYPQADATSTGIRRLPPDLGGDDYQSGGRFLHVHERGLLSKIVTKETALTSPESAFLYARDVINGRWPEAEEIIEKSFGRHAYLAAFPEASGRFFILSILRGGYLD